MRSPIDPNGSPGTDPEKLTNLGGFFGVLAVVFAVAMVDTSSLPSDVAKLLGCLGVGFVVGPPLGWLMTRATNIRSPLHTFLALGSGGIAIVLYWTLEGDQKFWLYGLGFWVSLAMVAQSVILLRQLKNGTSGA